MSRDIISIINKLLAKAESTTSEAEADAFFAKAQSLMVEHAITEAHLKEKGQASADPIVQKTVSIRQGMPRTKPLESFLSGISRPLNCRMYTYARSDLSVLVGHQSDVEFTRLMFASVQMQMHNALLREVKKAKRDHDAEYYGKFREGVWRRNFIEGYLSRVYMRVNERYTKVDETHGTGTSIVLRNRGKAVDDWLTEHVGPLKESKARKRQAAYDYAAQVRGAQAGEHADISGGRNAIKNERRELG